MRGINFARQAVCFFVGGVVLPSLFSCPEIFADTVVLKTGKDLKGLVVEEHEDRIIFSTENGEIPVLRRGIQKIDYDSPAQNFTQMGRAYEEKQRWGEALGYYEKALELDPNLAEAKKNVARVRNNFWVRSTAGPVSEIERKQKLYDAWGQGQFSATKNDQSSPEPMDRLEKNLGMRLEKKGDWVRLSEVVLKKDAAAAGLRKNDRLVAVDGNSLRYLSVEAVCEKLTSPRFSNFTLEYDHDCRVIMTGREKDLRDFGFELKLDAQGVIVFLVKPSTAASLAGLRQNDVVIDVNGVSMRYQPLKKLIKIIQKNPAETQVVFTVRRSALLARR